MNHQSPARAFCGPAITFARMGGYVASSVLIQTPLRGSHA
jgi:hypothetical protein